MAVFHHLIDTKVITMSRILLKIKIGRSCSHGLGYAGQSRVFVLVEYGVVLSKS